MSGSSKTNVLLGGCGYALFTAIFGCTLLVLNGGVVAAVYFSLAESGPAFLRNPRFSQLVLFVTPIILLYIEWSLTDFASRHSGGSDVTEEADNSLDKN